MDLWAPADAGRRTNLRPRDLTWEATLAACGVDQGELTASARSAANQAVKQLRDIGVEPAEIHRRAQIYRQKWPDMSLTPSALARHWAECAHPPNHVNGVSESVRQIASVRASMGLDQ